ncbi:MAG TPA: NAD(P)H-dependent oxidoreductase, partial [Pseudomonas sp.]|nr:NAD(P)H-dependent oxidoreductase [Pseudomonas sp.]
MSRVLVIESSARQEGSVSRQLTQTFVENWKQANPADSIQLRDLAKQPLPHLDMDLLGGWMKPAGQQSAAEQAAAQRSDALVA